MVKLDQKPKITTQVKIDSALQLHRPSTIHRASYRELNGTIVDLQTEKIGQSKNQNECSWRKWKGPGILLTARI